MRIEKPPAMIEALQWAENRWTLSDMEIKLRMGLCSQRAYDWYVFFWTWSAPRFGVYSHERFYKKRGDTAYWRRLNRVRKFITARSRLVLPLYDELLP